MEGGVRLQAKERIVAPRAGCHGISIPIRAPVAGARLSSFFISMTDRLNQPFSHPLPAVCVPTGYKLPPSGIIFSNLKS
jgi:hypothetical protein